MSDVPARDDTVATRLKQSALEQGFDAAGIARLRPSDHAQFYRAWLDAGHHGGMHYLSRPDAVERRLDPERAWPGLRSALVVALRYDPQPDDETDPSRGIIARYARGRDYHRVVKKKLMAVLRGLEDELGRRLDIARAYVDTGPVLERELARRAGLGWFGRNTMLLHPRRGSYFFLGTLLLELELETDDAFERDHCGRCNACVEACPTGALLGRDESGAPVMDARLCISYLTIENRGAIPVELRPLIGNRVFGCDVCQEVCPFNGKQTSTDNGLEGNSISISISTSKQGNGVEGVSLVEMMRMTEGEWDDWTRGSAIRRAGYAGLKRNVAVALGNWLAEVDEAPEEAVAVLREALEDEEPLVREHASWALERLRTG